MATLEDAELYLQYIERGLNDLKLKIESKQSQRVLSNHVWMCDYVENNIRKNIAPFKLIMSKVKDKHVGGFSSSTNFDVVSKHCTEMENFLNEMITLYKMRASLIDIEMKWKYSLPKINENFNHLKNRFNIIKGQLSKKQFEYEDNSSWF